MKDFYKLEEDFAIVELSKNIYPLVVIQKTISNYLEQTYIKLEELDNKIIIKIKSQTNDKLDNIIGEFYNELLRESLRYNIAMETKNLRELIIGRALYTTCIEIDEEKEILTNNDNISDITEDEDYSLDDIAVNWFSKYNND